MQHKSKKSRRMRGTETHGHGSAKKRRGAGHRGGRGKSGSGKRGDAKIMKVARGNKKYLGKYGFTSIKKEIRTINLEAIQDSLDTLVLQKLIKKKDDQFIIDLARLGYDKLLSKGNVAVKLNIKADAATPGAIKKVEEAGGKVELPVAAENAEPVPENDEEE